MLTREWDASSYHRLSDHQYEWGRKVLARLSLRGDEIVVDAGCGTCRITAELATLIPRGHVFAVDLSENMLRKGREFLEHNNRERHLEREPSSPSPPPAPVHLICADLAALPFRASVDVIFSTAAFHWVKDHDRLFQSLFVALKPGGWLEAQCGGGPNLKRLRQRAEALMSHAPFARFFAGWHPPQFYADEHTTAARLRSAGFTSMAVWLEPAGFSIDNVPDYRQYLATVTLHQHVARIADPDLRERFLDELTNQALADPELHLDYWRMNLRGRKPE